MVTYQSDTDGWTADKVIYIYMYIEIASCLQTFRFGKNCLNYLGGYKWGPPPPSKVGKEGGSEHGILPFDRVECQ